jgi:hypothetical protein
MEKIPIYKIINPYLLKIVNIDYIDKIISLDIIDFFYYFYDNDYIFINNKKINDVLNSFKLNNYYLECSIINRNNIFKNDNDKILTENEQLDVKKKINEYSNEVNRINEIYNYFKNNYDYNINRNYKNTHLSKKIKINKNSIKTYCNIEEFIKPMKKYIKQKFNTKFNEKDYSIIFILEIIHKLFNDYIKSLNYGIRLLTNEPYFIKCSNAYFPDIHIDNFKIDYDNNNILIKHLDLIKNINVINNKNDDIINDKKDYIKLYKTTNNNRINIYFE